MKQTEENIVYQLLSSVRGGELSNDEIITERRMRSFLRTQRADLVFKTTQKGLHAMDEYFQEVELTLIQVNEVQWVSGVPNIIQLPDNFGTKLMTPGFTNIPIVNEESYHLSRKNIVNKYLPIAKIENMELSIRIPPISPYTMDNALSGNILLECLKKNSNRIVLKAILSDPDDGIGYDWTTSKFPMPNEAIQALKESIARKDLSLILETKPDQVSNFKNDTLRYHDQGKVQQ